MRTGRTNSFLASLGHLCSLLLLLRMSCSLLRGRYPRALYAHLFHIHTFSSHQLCLMRSLSLFYGFFLLYSDFIHHLSNFRAAQQRYFRRPRRLCSWPLPCRQCFKVAKLDKWIKDAVPPCAWTFEERRWAVASTELLARVAADW